MCNILTLTFAPESSILGLAQKSPELSKTRHGRPDSHIVQVYFSLSFYVTTYSNHTFMEYGVSSVSTRLKASETIANDSIGVFNSHYYYT